MKNRFKENCDIHQILITDNNKIPNLPKFTEFCCETVKQGYCQQNYKLYSGEEIESILIDNFDKNVFLSYQKIKPYACKADLARSCILYLYGGLYIDLNLRILNPITIDSFKQYEFSAFRDFWFASTNSFAISNSVIYSEKKSKILERQIELIVRNCMYEYYASQPIGQTGPLVLGHAYQSVLMQDPMTDKYALIGNCQLLTPGMDVNNLAFVTNSGDIFCLKRREVNFTEVGIEGTNNYCDYFFEKKFYDENIKMQ